MCSTAFPPSSLTLYSGFSQVCLSAIKISFPRPKKQKKPDKGPPLAFGYASTCFLSPEELMHESASTFEAPRSKLQGMRWPTVTCNLWFNVIEVVYVWKVAIWDGVITVGPKDRFGQM
ncbi:MAG: hypothetical protein DRH17_05695 [Deltaproteobacteria bacterium]|nr:MAG: hypothetical protein DRH17_05695 [Deltaproteobacteria bacterium]